MSTLVPTTSPVSTRSLEATPSKSLPALRSADLPISESWLIAWAMAYSGYSAVVSLGLDLPAIHAARNGRSKLRCGVHLAHPVPIGILLDGAKTLRTRRSIQAILLIAEHPRTSGYREHLQLNDDEHVLGIRRRFREGPHNKRRKQLLGIIWNAQAGAFASFRTPIIGPCWRTVRALKQANPHRILTCELPGTGSVADVKGRIIFQLPPSSLRALAADLHFTTLREFVFAHPEAHISSEALLRGPLFIDADAQVLSDHTHIGPGWITADSPSTTIGTHCDVAELAFLGTTRPAPERPHHSPYFIGPQTRPRPAYQFCKRGFDITFALFALLITLPICLAVAIIIKAYDRGPIFFIHKREGRNGKPFGCMKFRTMVRDAEALKQKLRHASQVDGPQFKIANDPRITPIGRFIRKTNIDELPQFLNVLKGEMSIVGPRPSPYEENQLCPAWREARLSVTPGITGLWQISRSRERGAADFQEWIFYDTQYVERRSFWLDTKIVLLTIKELFGKGQ